jgi:hypothetical protein
MESLFGKWVEIASQVLLATPLLLDNGYPKPQQCLTLVKGGSGVKTAEPSQVPIK